MDDHHKSTSTHPQSTTLQIKPSFGWLRDLPDFRDYAPDHKEVSEILAQSTRLNRVQAKLPGKADLRSWFSPIEDQGNLGSCTANAGAGLVEYFQRRAFNEYVDASRLFLYKATRKLEGSIGDTGAYLRTTMKALVMFGVASEKIWPYTIAKFDDEPPAFCYAYGQNFKVTKYYRLDPIGVASHDVLAGVKQKLAAELPSMFGFTVYSSFPQNAGQPDIPMPKKGEKILGGHAVVAAGFDDTKKIGNSTGALLIRNSWGPAWGDQGYGWLPYDYVTSGLAVDFWSLVKEGFVSTQLFG
jgi:C1A family cysteine protease